LWRNTGEWLENTGFNETIFRIAESSKKAGLYFRRKGESKFQIYLRIEKRRMESAKNFGKPVDASLTIFREKDKAAFGIFHNSHRFYLHSSSTPRAKELG